MKALFAAAAFMAAAAAPAFAADPAAPAAGAPAAAPAPAINYVSPCKHPALEPYPVIPDAATAKNSDIARANKAYTTWNVPVKAFTECKRKELEDNAAAVKAQQAASPFGKMLEDYNAGMTEFDKGTADFKASGVPVTQLVGAPIKPGAACPPKPAAAPAPIPTMDAATAKKKDIKSAQEAFNSWAAPRYVYLKCREGELKTVGTQADLSLSPLKAKQDAIYADYEGVNNAVKAFNAKWDGFAKAYDARMKAAAQH